MASNDDRGMGGDALAQQIEFISNLFSTRHLRKRYLSFVVDNLKIWLGCQCVGIRVLDETGAMPYDAFLGFSYDFWQKENWLSVTKDRCSCVRVATSTPDPNDMQILTPYGSLWTNDLSAFCEKIPKELSDRYRCKCIEFGFASLAVIPIKHENAIIGLIHLADKRKGMFPIHKITLLEAVVESIGDTMSKYRTESAHRDRKDSLKTRMADIKECIGQIAAKSESARHQEMMAGLKEKMEAFEEILFHPSP